MQYRQLGASGLTVSVLSLGSWATFGEGQVQDDTAYDLMKAAFARGVNFFDCSESYAFGAAERILGSAIQRGIREGVWRREDLVISTKLFMGDRPDASINARGLSRKHIVEGTLASLARLGLEYVDVLFAHRFDPTTPMEEIVRSFNQLIQSGKTFYWGTSEWSGVQLAQARAVADCLGLIGPLCEQPEYSMYSRDRVEVEYAPLLASGLGLTTWSPLRSGILTGKYARGTPANSRLDRKQFAGMRESSTTRNLIDKTKKLVPIAEGLGCSLSQLAIAWCCLNPHVSTVILGATSVAQLEENLDALDVLPRLLQDGDEVRRIEAVLANRPKPARFSRQVEQVMRPRPATKAKL